MAPVTLALRLVRGLASLMAVGVVAAALVTFLPIWPLSLFDHFRIHYIVVGLVATGAAAALQLRGYFDASAIATLVHACVVLSDAPRSTLPEHGTSVRVLVLNVHTGSSNFDAVRQLIDDTHPDIIGLVEVDQRWLDALAPSLAPYTGRIEHPRDDNFGIALYARGTVNGGPDNFGSMVPSILASVALPSATLTVVVTHPVPPLNSDSAARLEDQLDAVALAVRGGTNVVVMGDFNSTPWSRPFRRLLAGSGLCDSRDGLGLQPTFPAHPSILRIPIDHLLHSCSIGISERRVERDVGSDHLPVVVDLVVPR